MVSSRASSTGATLLLLLFTAAPVVEALTEFSADISYFDSGKNQISAGQLFVSDRAIREERTTSQGKEIIITDLFYGTTYVLNPETGEYHEQDALPVPRNPAQFCAEMPLLLCGFQREEELMGIKTERWGADLGFGELTIGVVAWYDPEIQYPIRVEFNEVVQQLSNVRKGRVSSTLFSIPIRYRMVERERVEQGAGFPEWP